MNSRKCLKYFFVFAVCFAQSGWASACPKEFLGRFSAKEHEKFLLCHEFTDQNSLIALHRINEYRIDVELYGKERGAYQATVLDTFKDIGDTLLEISYDATKTLSVVRDINNDGKADFVFRTTFPRGAFFMAARPEGDKLQFVSFFPAETTAGEPNPFLIHSEKAPLVLAKKHEIQVMIENSDMGKVRKEKATYSLRKGGSYYLSKIRQ